MEAHDYIALRELSAQTGYDQRRISGCWRDGIPIEGRTVESIMGDDGARLWRIAPLDAPDPEPSSEEGDGTPELPLDEAPIHGRTLGALADAGLLYSGDVVRFLDDPPHADAAAGRLRKLDGVGKKGAEELVAWLLEVGAWVDPEVEGDPVRVITFGELEVGDCFEAEGRGGVVTTYEKVPADRHTHETWPEHVMPGDTGAPYNARRLDGELAGTFCFFTNDFEIHYDTIEDDEMLSSEHLRARARERTELADRLNAWLAARFTPLSKNKKGFATYSDADLGSIKLDHAHTFDNIHQVRLGNPTSSLLEADIRALLDRPADWTDEDEAEALDFEFDDLPTSGEPKTYTAPETVQRPPCTCLTPVVPDGAEGWVKCEERGCKGYVQVKPQRTATDGEMVTAEYTLDVPAKLAAREAKLGIDDLFPPPEASVPGGGRPAPRIPYHVLPSHPVDSEKWHAQRARGIGSSDAGGIIGVSEHATTKDVWRSKTGEPEVARPWLDAYSAFGRWFEAYLLEHCELTSGVTITPGEKLGTLQSIEWPVAQANLDGLDEVNGIVEELKTSSEEWTTIPEAYVAQVQHQMFVCGAREARIRQYIAPISRELAMDMLERIDSLDPDEFAAWLLDAGKVVTWIVERDDVYIDRLVEREREFWSYVEREEEPPDADPDGTIDLTDDPDVFRLVHEYARAAATIDKTAQKAADAVKKDARKAIERAVALSGEDPKRVVCGEHKATLVVRDTHSYWNIYTGEVGDDGIIF